MNETQFDELLSSVQDMDDTCLARRCMACAFVSFLNPT